MRPHVTCHMAGSLDGRILPSRWAPRGAHRHDTYERLHKAMDGGSWLVGRVTGQEFAKAQAYAAIAEGDYPRTAWLPRGDAKAFGIVLDRHGKIAWGRSEVGGDPIVVVLGQDVPDTHLAGLRADGVGYVFAGDRDFSLTAALEAIGRELGVDRLLLEGGGDINGAFLREGLVDELSLVVTPAVDGRRGAPGVFDGPPEAVAASIKHLRLMSHEVIDGDALWLRYQIEYE